MHCGRKDVQMRNKHRLHKLVSSFQGEMPTRKLGHEVQTWQGKVWESVGSRGVYSVPSNKIPIETHAGHTN